MYRLQKLHFDLGILNDPTRSLTLDKKKCGMYNRFVDKNHVNIITICHKCSNQIELF